MSGSPVPITVSELRLVLQRGALTLVDVEHAVLHQPARAFSTETLASRELRELIRRMWSVLDRLETGVGLAAPQLGLDYALFLVDDQEQTRLAVANPRRQLLVPLPPQVSAREGCLSLPGWWGEVPRPERLRLRAWVQGANGGREQDLEFGGFVARIFGHELDHLSGRLFRDRALSLEAEPRLANAATSSRRGHRGDSGHPGA